MGLPLCGVHAPPGLSVSIALILPSSYLRPHPSEERCVGIDYDGQSKKL